MYQKDHIDFIAVTKYANKKGFVIIRTLANSFLISISTIEIDARAYIFQQA